MIRPVFSPAAAALVRALTERASVSPGQIVITSARSVDWQSLTFTGERHALGIKLLGNDCAQAAQRLCDGIEEAELSRASTVVADIAVLENRLSDDGSYVSLAIEALTIES